MAGCYDLQLFLALTLCLGFNTARQLPQGTESTPKDLPLLAESRLLCNVTAWPDPGSRGRCKACLGTQNRLLWRDKTCRARTHLIMSWKAFQMSLINIMSGELATTFTCAC